MQIIENHSDIFKSECDCIVNPTNSIGVMGGGLAASFMKRFPKECTDYNRRSLKFQGSRKTYRLMPPVIYNNYPTKQSVLMFATKVDFRNPSEIEYIAINMERSVELLNMELENIKSVAFPMLGCGLGGLDWNAVKPIMIDKLKKYKGEKIELHVSPM